MMTETSVEMIGVTIIEMMTEIMAEVGMIGTETIVIVIGEGIVGMIVIHIETVTGMGIGTGIVMRMTEIEIETKVEENWNGIQGSDLILKVKKICHLYSKTI